MKLIVFVVLALIAATNANFISRTCSCKAVSDTVHFPLKSWGTISSCKFCSCSDPSMVNCESACQSTVQTYTNTGCGILSKNTKLVYSYDTGNCGSGYGSNAYTCL